VNVLDAGFLKQSREETEKKTSERKKENEVEPSGCPESIGE
jgi:hypothetical protein